LTRNEQNANAAVEEVIALQQAANWMLERYLRQLRELEADIIAETVRADATDGRTESSRRRRLDELLTRLDRRIREVFDELASRMESDLEELADIEAERERERILAIFGIRLDGTVDAAAIATAAILGITVRQMIVKQAGELSYRLRGRLTRAADAMEPTAETAGKLKRGDERSAEPPIMRPTRTALETIATTATQGAAQQAATEVVTASTIDRRTIRYGWQQISILDARTSRICWAYAFKTWDAEFQPLGHALPYNGGVPRHPHCRSRIILVLLDEDAVAEQTFREWATKQSGATLERMFGKESVRQWRAGNLGDNDLIRSRTGSISLDELRQFGKE